VPDDLSALQRLLDALLELIERMPAGPQRDALVGFLATNPSLRELRAWLETAGLVDHGPAERVH
jgi:hypothetical protein